MLALRSQFDGRKIITPHELESARPCDVIIVVLDTLASSADATCQALQQHAIAEVWANHEDAVYDEL